MPLLRAKIFQAGAPVAVQLGVAGCLVRVGAASLVDPVAARVPLAFACFTKVHPESGAVHPAVARAAG